MLIEAYENKEDIARVADKPQQIKTRSHFSIGVPRSRASKAMVPIA